MGVYQPTNSALRQLRQPNPESLFEHLFGELEGWLVTFTGVQARFSRPTARPNELADTRQRSWSYPSEGEKAACYLLEESAAQRDAYVAVHLFREANTRLASKALSTVRALWLDEDEGLFPEDGPEPTAIVHSSATRRHLYWRLAQPVTVEWAVTMNRRIALWAGGDSGKAGLASVLRPPATANYKRHPQVDQVVGELTGAEPWDPLVLEQAIPLLPKPESRSRRHGPYNGPEIELAEYLEEVEVLGEVRDELGKKFAIVCPWIAEHSGGDRSGTYIGQRSSGGLWFFCNHEHCQARDWRDFREKACSSPQPTRRGKKPKIFATYTEVIKHG